MDFIRKILILTLNDNIYYLINMINNKKDFN